MDSESIPRLPKLCGADVELANFVLGVERPDGTGYEASRAVLREIDGVPSTAAYPYAYEPHGWGGAGHAGAGYSLEDWGRKFLLNGASSYVDLDHAELALPEVISAVDHLRAWHAMLRIARRACVRANERLAEGRRICLLVNNSDGQSNSYGSHLNFLLTRRAWNNIFNRRLHYQVFLAGFQTSSIVYTGAGKVGAENGMADVEFQLSQRADFFEILTGFQTTFNRPIVNSRDESLCGSAGSPGDREMARLHCIFFDAGLCHIAHVLKVGTMQIVLAMIEAERVDMDLDLLLEDPVDAVHGWSHDRTLRTTARTLSGAELTAIELQQRIAAEARRFVEAGGCDGLVPQAREIVDVWEDTLAKLETLANGRDPEAALAALAPRLDWALKFRLLSQCLAEQPELTWQSPEIRYLDQIYGSLDPEEGLYWRAERLGAVDRIARDEEIEHFVHHAPEDTRAWTRAYLLARAGQQGVASVNWDTISFEAETGDWWRRGRPTLSLPNPLGFTKRDIEQFTRADVPLHELLDQLGAFEPQTTVPAAVARPRVLS
jgi:hypothetical protein